MKQLTLGALSPEDDEELQGTLDRVVFHNQDNGYTVMRLRCDRPVNGEESFAVIGYMSGPQPGMHMKVKGRFVEHPKFGRQLQMSSWEESRPATLEGIRLFLASGCIKGIGGVWADRIVEKFGAETLKILDHTPQRLLELPRFGKKRLDGVIESWSAHTGVRDLMMFLQPHGIGPSYAVRIFKYYGGRAMDVVKENPYRLAMDIHGVGFLTADALAAKLGIERDSPLRAEAGLLYTLVRLNEDGHMFYPRGELLEMAARDLDIDVGLMDDALERLQQSERVVVEDLGEEEGVYLSLQHHYEERISYYMQRLLRSPKSVFFENPKEAVAKVLESMKPMELAAEQKEAVHKASVSKVMVLTGGPGTGKTTILNAIIRLFSTTSAKILLAAPTGRAAKRMAEACGREAKTIHRLLEYSPQEDGFGRNENNPLACGLLVVDEASMMDTMLMYHLIKAAPLGATFILVGDVNQLPSVGPGNVLRDIIASGVVPVVELMEVFRQAAESDIICNAHRINVGEMPLLRQSNADRTDFFMFKEGDAMKAADLVVDLVSRRIPSRFGFAPEDIQVLSPMLKGAAGVANLNAKLQQALNPRTECLQRGERQFRFGDKVMQIRNNYDKDVFNGDMGTVIHLDTEERLMTVRYDERNVVYLYDELDELVTAYAISIHKSQGGEYPVVVIPLLMQHYVLLQRNLVYTAVTRGRKLVVLVGETKALAMAVHNNRIRHRYTWLAKRLAGDESGLPGLRPPKAEKARIMPEIADAEQDAASAEYAEYEMAEAFDDMPPDDMAEIMPDDMPPDDWPPPEPDDLASDPAISSPRIRHTSRRIAGKK